MRIPEVVLEYFLRESALKEISVDNLMKSNNFSRTKNFCWLGKPRLAMKQLVQKYALVVWFMLQMMYWLRKAPTNFSQNSSGKNVCAHLTVQNVSV